MVMESSGNLLALLSALLSIHTWWAWSCTYFYPFHRGSQLKPQSWVYIEIQFPILTMGKIASNFTRPRLCNLVNESVKYLGFFVLFAFFFSREERVPCFALQKSFPSWNKRMSAHNVLGTVGGLRMTFSWRVRQHNSRGFWPIFFPCVSCCTSVENTGKAPYQPQAGP